VLEFYLRLLSGLTQLWGHTSEKKITVSVVDTVAPTIKMASDVINLDVGQVTSVSYDDLPIEVADKSEIDHNSLSFRKMVKGGTTYPIEKVYDKSSESLKFEKMGEYYGHFSIADTEGNTSEFDIQYDVHDQNPPVVYSYVNTVSGKTRENKSIVD